MQTAFIKSPCKIPNKSLIKKTQLSSAIKPLEMTKVYYWFNSKGDDIWQYFYGQSIACSNHSFTKDFVGKDLFCIFKESTDNSNAD